LLPFAAISLCYFGFAGLFGTYAPLWYQSLGYSTFAIGALTALQSATRVFAPYAWGWSADHTGRREYLLRLKHAFDKADIQQPRSTVTIMERSALPPTPEGPPK